MSLTLPTTPAPRAISPRLISSRNELSPAFGGDKLRLNRKGSRWALDYELPPQTYMAAQAWADLDAEVDTVVMPVTQYGLNTGSPGSPIVDGASQAGSTLNVKGMTVAYAFAKNQWISVITASRRYLYRVTAATVVDGLGKAALPIRPQLRTPPANLDVVEVATPKIEGYASVGDGAWSYGTDGFVTLSFTIEERG